MGEVIGDGKGGRPSPRDPELLHEGRRARPGARVRDVLFWVRAAAGEIGVAAVLVHALNDDAKRFYLTCGFAESPIDPLILVARLKDVEAALALPARLHSSTKA